MQFESTVRRLESALAQPMPGAIAQDRMAPRPRREWPQDFNPARARLAAGLLLLFERDSQAFLILTVRTHRVRHGGQVSLPGGVVDPGESFEQAALREAQEEIGLSRHGVRLLGLLSPVDIPVSGFRLHPVVAVALAAPQLQPSDLEVARILEVPLDVLMAADAFSQHTIVREERAMTVPAFLVDGLHVWGATAMVLAEFLSLLGWRGHEID